MRSYAIFTPLNSEACRTIINSPTGYEANSLEALAFQQARFHRFSTIILHDDTDGSTGVSHVSDALAVEIETGDLLRLYTTGNRPMGNLFDWIAMPLLHRLDNHAAAPLYFDLGPSPIGLQAIEHVVPKDVVRESFRIPGHALPIFLTRTSVVKILVAAMTQIGDWTGEKQIYLSDAIRSIE